MIVLLLSNLSLIAAGVMQNNKKGVFTFSSAFAWAVSGAGVLSVQTENCVGKSKEIDN